MQIQSAQAISGAGTPMPRGPKGKPLVGIAYEMRRDPLNYFIELMMDYGDIVPFKIGTDPVVMLNNPEHIQHVLQDNHQNYLKSKFYKPLRAILGHGIFLSEKEEWKAQRLTAKPHFGGPEFARMADQIVDVTDDVIDRWHDRFADGQPFDLVPEMMRLALDAVTTAMFSTRFDDEHQVFYDALGTILKECERRVWLPMQMPEFVNAAMHPEFPRAQKTIHEVIGGVIEERKANPRHNDLLTTFIEAYKDVDPTLLVNQVMSIITAGHETTAISLSWMYYMLSKHPDIQRKVEDEVDMVLGGRRPRFEDLKQLRYTRMVFEEAMRIHPPVHSISRGAIEDDEIGGVRIPAGTTVMLSPYAVHRNPKIWPNPEGFDPERFAPERERERARYAYFPFGGGPRKCLGDRFALMEAVLVISRIAQRHRLRIVPGQHVVAEPMITLRPRDGIQVTMHDRADEDLHAIREAA